MSDASDVPEEENRRLNRMVAVTVVVLSVAMAVGKIKDDNIVQAMQAAQADKIDLSDGFLSIAVAVAAIAALIESMALLGIAWASSGLGLLFLVAGFAELPIHPDRLIGFLT